MRGFAVAAGGWDDEEVDDAPALRLVTSTDGSTDPVGVPEPEHAPVVEIASRREELDAAEPTGETLIYAW